MLTQIINGRIFTPQGWLNEGSVLMRDGKILEVTNCDLALIGANLVDARGMYIVPGFVCMHAHGGGGHDFYRMYRRGFPYGDSCTHEARCHQLFPDTFFFSVLRNTQSCRYMRKTDGRTR